MFDARLYWQNRLFYDSCKCTFPHVQHVAQNCIFSKEFDSKECRKHAVRRGANYHLNLKPSGSLMRSNSMRPLASGISVSTRVTSVVQLLSSVCEQAQVHRSSIVARPMGPLNLVSINLDTACSTALQENKITFNRSTCASAANYQKGRLASAELAQTHTKDTGAWQQLPDWALSP